MVPKAAPTGGAVATPTRATSREGDVKSIAILPFTNRSSDEENQYLCDGLAEELIGGLSKIEDLHVAAQLSAFALKNQNLDIETIGNRLRVRHVLSGSVQKSAQRVRVNVSLNDVQSGHTIWSERYDGTLDDVFELQENMARQIVTALKVELGAQQHATRLINVGTLNPQAYDLFLLAQHAFGQLTQRSLALAADYFRKAAELDPAFGRAHWMRLICYVVLMRDFGTPADDLLPRAKAAIAEMETTPFVAPAPRVQVRRWLKEVRNSERELAFEAIEKVKHPDPTWNQYQLWQLTQCLSAAGLVTGAIDYIKRYLSLAPQHVENTNAGMFHTSLLELAGRLDEAIEVQSEFVAANPDRPLAFGMRIMLFSRTGQYARAERDLKELSRIFPRNFAQFYHLYWTGPRRSTTSGSSPSRDCNPSSSAGHPS
jgi:TolB-like protein